MPNISRVNDVGHGQCFVGHPDVPAGSPKDFTCSIISGAATVFMNNRPVAFVSSVGTADCGHNTIAISGSDTVFAENQPVHRINDIGAIMEGDGVYHMISASPDVDN